MEKLQTEKYYDYRPIVPMLICAFIPLVCCSSVGPEAGLTGIIAALCYWVGDNVTYAKEHAQEFSQIGEAVTLGQLFLYAPRSGAALAADYQGRRTKQSGKEEQRADL